MVIYLILFNIDKVCIIYSHMVKIKNLERKREEIKKEKRINDMKFFKFLNQII